MADERRDGLDQLTDAARAASKTTFSVAPTLGKGRQIRAPRGWAQTARRPSGPS